MKSKGVIPALAMIFLSLLTIRGYLISLPLSSLVNKNLCYVESFINSPSTLTMISLACLVLIKYVIIKNLNNRKETIYHQKGKELKMKWQYRFLKISQNWYMYILYISIVYLTCAIFQLIVLAAFKFQCNATQSIVSQLVYNVKIFIVILIAFGFCIYDIILNFDKVKKCDLLAFWKEDIYYTRFEFYVAGIILSGFTYVTYFIVFFSVYDNVASLPIITLAFFFIYMFLMGIPVITTFYNIVYSYNIIHKQTVDERGELSKMLEIKDGYNLLFEACKLEFSIENINCWKDIQEYKKEKTFIKRKELSQDIQRLYLNGTNSELELNIPGELGGSIVKKIQSETYEMDLFSELELNILLNLNDVFLRLKQKKEYQIWKKQGEFLKENQV